MVTVVLFPSVSIAVTLYVIINPPLNNIHKKEDLLSYRASPLLLVLLRCMRHLRTRRFRNDCFVGRDNQLRNGT